MEKDGRVSRFEVRIIVVADVALHRQLVNELRDSRKFH